MLHESCAVLPTRKWHVVSMRRYHLFTNWCMILVCEACGVCYNGFTYSSGPSTIDVRCASVSEPFVHQSHPHHPLYYTTPRGVCSACNKEAHAMCWDALKMVVDTSWTSSALYYHMRWNIESTTIFFLYAMVKMQVVNIGSCMVFHLRRLWGYFAYQLCAWRLSRSRARKRSDTINGTLYVSTSLQPMQVS